MVNGCLSCGAHPGKKQDFVPVIQLIFLLTVLWGGYDFYFHYYFFFFEGKVEAQRD